MSLLEKNIQAPDGTKYYIDKFSRAHMYSEKAWANRSTSCDTPVIEVDLKQYYKFLPASAMTPSAPCGLEGKNVTMGATIGPAPPVNYCESWSYTQDCNPAGTITNTIRDCNVIIPDGVSGFCTCANGQKAAEVNCSHKPFTCEEACGPNATPSIWKLYDDCNSYVGTSDATPLLCLNPLDGECLPPTLPATSTNASDLLASCPQNTKLINNSDFVKKYGPIVSSCQVALSRDPGACSTGSVCPMGVEGAARSPLKSGGQWQSQNYKCCGGEWSPVNIASDVCPDYDDTIVNCGCDWTMDNSKDQAAKRLSADIQTKWGAPYKWCWTPNSLTDKEACEGGLGGSGCILSDKGHCETKVPVIVHDPPPPACKLRSYKMFDPSGYACANTEDKLYEAKGDLGTLTDMCDRWPTCRYVDYSPTTIQGGPYGILYSNCTAQENLHRQIYDAGVEQIPCWPNELPGGGFTLPPAFKPPTYPCPGTPACTGRGFCDNETDPGTCHCNSGYTGSDCASKKCPNNCNGNGTCDGTTGTCKCSTGYTGNDCSSKTCPGGPSCSGHGRCDHTTGTCTCMGKYTGSDCGTPPPIPCSPPDCNGHGTCNKTTGKCACTGGYTGSGCSGPPPKKCPDNCSGHGTCDTKTGKCACTSPYIGPNCGGTPPPPPPACDSNPCPHMMGSWSKSYQEHECSLYCGCVFEDHWYGNTCER